MLAVSRPSVEVGRRPQPFSILKADSQGAVLRDARGRRTLGVDARGVVTWERDIRDVDPWTACLPDCSAVALSGDIATYLDPSVNDSGPMIAQPGRVESLAAYGQFQKIRILAGEQSSFLAMISTPGGNEMGLAVMGEGQPEPLFLGTIPSLDYLWSTPSSFSGEVFAGAAAAYGESDSPINVVSRQKSTGDWSLKTFRRPATGVLHNLCVSPDGDNVIALIQGVAWHVDEGSQWKVISTPGQSPSECFAGARGVLLAARTRDQNGESKTRIWYTSKSREWSRSYISEMRISFDSEHDRVLISGENVTTCITRDGLESSVANGYYDASFAGDNQVLLLRGEEDPETRRIELKDISEGC